MSGAGSRSRPSAPAAAPSLFDNALFNSAAQAQAVPQYVAQPSSAGAQPDVVGTRKGQPIYGPPKAFNPYQAVPAWARSTPSMAPDSQFGNALFNSAPNPYIAPQAVVQSGNSVPAKGGK